MKLKALALTIAITLTISIGVSANEVMDLGFDKYKDSLIEIGHTEEEILQMEKEYNGIKINKSESDVDKMITSYIEGVEKYKDFDANKEAVPLYDGISTSKEEVMKSNARGVSFNMIEPGDIILEPNRAVNFGHTSSVYVNTDKVVEALADEVSSLNSTKTKWNDMSSRQYWMRVDRYSLYTRTRAASNGFRYLNKP